MPLPPLHAASWTRVMSKTHSQTEDADRGLGCRQTGVDPRCPESKCRARKQRVSRPIFLSLVESGIVRVRFRQ